MSTCDVPYIAMKDIVEGENPYTGKKIAMPENKLPYTVYRTKFRIVEQEKYNFAVTESFLVENKNIFDLTNWRRID
jgi:hypothetical protein